MNNGYQITGVVVQVGPLVKIGDDGLEKRILLVEDENHKYNNVIPIEFFGRNVTLLEAGGIDRGSRVTVGFDIEAREHNDRYFVDLRGWRVSVLLDDVVVDVSPG